MIYDTCIIHTSRNPASSFSQQGISDPHVSTVRTRQGTWSALLREPLIHTLGVEGMTLANPHGNLRNWSLLMMSSCWQLNLDEYLAAYPPLRMFPGCQYVSCLTRARKYLMTCLAIHSNLFFHKNPTLCMPAWLWLLSTCQWWPQWSFRNCSFSEKSSKQIWQHLSSSEPGNTAAQWERGFHAGDVTMIYL